MLLKKEEVRQMIFESSLELGLDDAKDLCDAEENEDENVFRFWAYVLNIRAYEDVIFHDDDGVIEFTLTRPLGEKKCSDGELCEVINRVNSELHYGGAVSYDKEKNELVVRNCLRIYDGLYDKPISHAMNWPFVIMDAYLTAIGDVVNKREGLERHMEYAAGTVEERMRYMAPRW